MTLNEYLGSQNLFLLMKQANPDLTFINDESVNELDNLLRFNYGDKPIFSKVAPHGLELVAGFLINLHADNWLRLVELSTLANQLSSGEVRTVTENIDNTENRNNESENINKVSAFNSDDLIPDEGSNTLSNDTVQGSKTRTLTDTKKDLKTLYNNLSLSHKNHIMKVVLNDVKDFLTLTIY